MIDHRIRQQMQMEKEGRDFLGEVNQETFVLKVRRKDYPPGTTWMWALGAAFGPPKKKQERDVA